MTLISHLHPLQVRILATDSGAPPKSNTTTVTINVRRNLARPTFNPLRYSSNIMSTDPLGKSVTKVTATDADIHAPYNTIEYRIVGDNRARKFFYVDPPSGEISLKQSIQNEADNSFSVREKAEFCTLLYFTLLLYICLLLFLLLPLCTHDRRRGE